MKYKDAISFRQALERRIANDASGDQNLTRWRRQSIAFDRIIARIVAISPDAFYLKGGLALQYRFGESARRTVDMDFAATGSECMREVMLGASTTDLKDFFELHIASEPTAPLVEDEGVAAYRWAVDTFLGSRRFERVFIDIGVGDAADRQAFQKISTQPVLEFAGIAPVEIRVISLEQHISEKLHAYVRSYGDAHNTRVKDLVDLALLSRMKLTLDPIALRAAIDRTFKTRGTSEVPSELPPPPERWREKFKELSNQLAIPNDIIIAHREAVAMLERALRLIE